MKNKILLLFIAFLFLSFSFLKLINYSKIFAAYDPVIYDNNIAFTATLNEDGKVTASWSKYNHNETFTYYKLVRSSTVNNPVYPENSYIYFTTNANILTYTDTKAPIGISYYRICHIASGKRYCSETVITINKPSSNCADSSWTPDSNTVCSGISFTQTSNCGNSRQSTGTKSCNTCTDSSWTPDPSIVCNGEYFTQTSNCGNSRQSTGTKSCIVKQNIFYIDPINGNNLNNGSESSPWKTLDITKIQSQGPSTYPHTNSGSLKIINPNGPIKPGSIIYLKSGNYGTLNLYGYYNSDYITISAAPSSVPVFDQIRIYGGTKWKFNGITIRGEKVANWQYLVYLINHNWHGPISNILFENSNIYSVQSINGFTKDDWNNKVANALITNGSNITIKNNNIKNINFGIITAGNNILVENNTIENYCGDGMRFGGNDNVFQYNTIKNNFSVNLNHNDGIQAVLLPLNNTPIYRVTLRGNIIIGNEDPNQPFSGSVQGIGVFDNSIVDSLIENNVIMVDHWHGITLMGAVNTKIINNTVFNPYRFGERNYRNSWISVIPAKNGTHGKNCIIRNNITRQILSNNNDNVIVDHNLSGQFNPVNVFKDYQKLDLQLKQNSPAIDVGISLESPNIDILKISRPQGKMFDLGAYEFLFNIFQ